MKNKDLMLQMMLQEVKVLDDCIDWKIVGNEVVGSELVGDGLNNGEIIWHINYTQGKDGEITYVLREEWQLENEEELEDKYYTSNNLKKLIEEDLKGNMPTNKHIKMLLDEIEKLISENKELRKGIATLETLVDIHKEIKNEYKECLKLTRENEILKANKKGLN